VDSMVEWSKRSSARSRELNRLGVNAS
jgi:hypothetical protein